MSIEVACSCGRTFQTKNANAGRRAKCPACGGELNIPSRPNPFEDQLSVESTVPDAILQVNRHLAEIKDLLGGLIRALTTTPRKEYKVLTQKDKWFSGKFDPDRLEEAINAYTSQGWVVRGVTTAAIPGFAGTRDEMIILMER